MLRGIIDAMATIMHNSMTLYRESIPLSNVTPPFSTFFNAREKALGKPYDTGSLVKEKERDCYGGRRTH